MAERSLIVCNPLCFLLAKFSNTPVKALKCALVDFYSDKDLSEAKQLLINDINRINTDNTDKPPRVTTRRDGPDKSIHEVDDIFSLLTFLDEQKLIGCLSKYVSDSPDNLPSIRLYEGDLKILMDFITKLNNRMCAIESTLTSIRQEAFAPLRSSTVRPPVFVSNQSTPVRPVNHSAVISQAQSTLHPETSAASMHYGHSTASSLTLPSACGASTITSAAIPAETAVKGIDNANQQSWASKAENVSHCITSDGCSNCGSQSCCPSDSDQPFTEYSSRQSRRKRRRQYSAQLNIAGNQLNGSTRNQQPSALINSQTAQKAETVIHPRRAPMVIGKSTRQPVSGCKITAAKTLVKKAVFCIDNVDKSVTVNDMIVFVTSLSVKVITCFEAKPRKRRSEENGESNSKAFRLCINNEHRQKLLDPDVWPAYITISDWFFKADKGSENGGNGANRMKERATSVFTTTASAGSVNSNVADAGDAADPAASSDKTTATNLSLPNGNDMDLILAPGLNASSNFLSDTLSDTIIYNAAS